MPVRQLDTKGRVPQRLRYGTFYFYRFFFRQTGVWFSLLSSGLLVLGQQLRAVGRNRDRVLEMGR